MVPFIKHISTVYRRYSLASLLLITAIFLGLISFQGFDVCDEGWYLSFYQQIFNAPETVEYNFAFWLTGIVGGIWYQIFPAGGILSFRILTILVLISTLFVAYKILKDYLTNFQITFGLLMIIIVNDFGYLAFYYNHLSGLLALVTIYFLIKGIKNERLIWIGIAGLMTSVNVFSRLPNVTLFALALIFPFQLLWTKSVHNKYWIKQLSIYLVGVVVGFLITYFFMFLLGHIEIMHNSILGILNKGQNPDSNHNVLKLLTVYRYEYSLIVKSGIKIVAVFFFLIISKSWMSKNKIANLVWYSLGVLLFIYIFRFQSIYSLYFISLIGTTGILFLKDGNSYIKSLSFLSLIMMIFLPLGSDGGIYNAGYVSIWLSVPLFLWFYFQIINLKFRYQLFEMFFVTLF